MKQQRFRDHFHCPRVHLVFEPSARARNTFRVSPVNSDPSGIVQKHCQGVYSFTVELPGSYQYLHPAGLLAVNHWVLRVYRFYYARVTRNPRNPDLRAAPPLKAKQAGTQSFDECVRSGAAQCTYKTGKAYDLSVPYFCGHHEWCM
jgi:hypothetical protein